MKNQHTVSDRPRTSNGVYRPNQNILGGISNVSGSSNQMQHVNNSHHKKAAQTQMSSFVDNKQSENEVGGLN